nr:hypothetical protein [Tanacetum cinerariifolium]
MSNSSSTDGSSGGTDGSSNDCSGGESDGSSSREFGLNYLSGYPVDPGISIFGIAEASLGELISFATMNPRSFSTMILNLGEGIADCEVFTDL